MSILMNTGAEIAGGGKVVQRHGAHRHAGGACLDPVVQVRPGGHVHQRSQWLCHTARWNKVTLWHPACTRL